MQGLLCLEELRFVMTTRALEDLIFEKLLKHWPTAFGHVSEVYSNRWLTVYVFLKPEAVEEKDFAKVVETADAIVGETEFAGSICRHKDSVGKELRGWHYYNFWLPIFPSATKNDFAVFFPMTRPLW